MQKEQLIALQKFYSIYELEVAFISSLNDSGLIDIIKSDDTEFITESNLLKLEKMVTLNRELGINFEGIETINHLLDKINEMQLQIDMLKNKLLFYEDFE